MCFYKVNCPGEFKNITCVRIQQDLQDQEVINKNNYLSIFFFYFLLKKRLHSRIREKKGMYLGKNSLKKSSALKLIFHDLYFLKS